MIVWMLTLYCAVYFLWSNLCNTSLCTGYKQASRCCSCCVCVQHQLENAASPFPLGVALWRGRKQDPLGVGKQPAHVWTPSCHHLWLRWSDKWDFNWVFRLSHIRRWDRIIQEHINVIKSFQIWQLYCIRKLPALLLSSSSPQCQCPSRACCFEPR